MSTPSSKIQRILEQLIPQSELSNMVSKHSATLLSGGKMMCLGHNHLRSCNANKARTAKGERRQNSKKSLDHGFLLVVSGISEWHGMGSRTPM